MLRRIVLLPLLGTLSTLSAQQSDHPGHGSPQAVIGGTEAEEGQYPWMTMLQGDGEDLCGGSLIAPTWVLTAGHCGQGFAGIIPQPDLVFVNLVYRDAPWSGTQILPVTEIHVHSDYSLFTGGPDIALLRLGTPSSIAPVALATTAMDGYYAGGTPSTVLGWGITDQGTQSDVLRVGQISVIDHGACSVAYAGELGDYEVCAGYLDGSDPEGAGAGDSGGPLFVQVGGVPHVIGIVSHGNGEVTTAQHPGVFTSVRAHLDWIDGIMNGPAGVEGPRLQEELRLVVTDDGLRLNSTVALAGAAEITVHDAQGRLVHAQRGTVSVGDTYLPLPQVAAGLHVFRIVDGTGLLFSSTFATVR